MEKIKIILIMLLLLITATFGIKSTQNLYSSIKKLEQENKELLEQLKDCQNMNEIRFTTVMDLQERNNKLKEVINNKIVITVYNAKKKQTNKDNSHTASNYKIDTLNPIKHKIVALSRDLLLKYPYKTKLSIKGIGELSGVWQVQDKMNKRYSNRFDLLINSDMPVNKWQAVLY